jgi:hypothetical protein
MFKVLIIVEGWIASVVKWSEVPGSIPGATTFSEK